jgi:predicted transcriptional regulator
VASSAEKLASRYGFPHWLAWGHVLRGWAMAKLDAKRAGEGVRLIQEREARLAALDASIARGIADADAGRAKPAKAVFDRLEAKFKAKAAICILAIPPNCGVI